MNIFLIVLLLILSAIFSGLSLGLMSLSTSDLKRKADIGNKYAQKIYLIRRDGNLLLTTLLVGNVFVNSFLSILIGELFIGIIAVLASTTLITIFGEIAPQAFCSKYPLKIGYILLPLVKFYIFILYPICKPISMTLDHFLGRDLNHHYSRKELELLIKEHGKEDVIIDKDEKDIMLGAMSFSDKEVEQIMTPKKNVFMLEENDQINDNLLDTIKEKGHTRIPVFKQYKDNVIGILLVKDLLGTDILMIKEAKLRKSLKVHLDTRLDILLNQLILNKSHLAIVTDHYDTVVGVVTMEDIMEEIIKREIVDETDEHSDMRSF